MSQRRNVTHLLRATQIGNGRVGTGAGQSDSRVCARASGCARGGGSGGPCLGGSCPAGETDIRGDGLSMASAGKGAGVGLWIGLSDLVSHLKWAGQCLERGPCRESCLQPQLRHCPSPWWLLRGGLRPSPKLVHPAGPVSSLPLSLLCPRGNSLLSAKQPK